MPEPLRVGQGIGLFAGVRPDVASRSAAEQALAELGGSWTPALALVFCSDTCPDLPSMLRGLREALSLPKQQAPPMLGCTSPWPVTSRTESLVVEHGVVVTLLAGDDLDVKTAALQTVRKYPPDEAATRLVTALNLMHRHQGQPHGLVLALLPGFLREAGHDPPSFRDEELFLALTAELLSSRVPLFAGSAASNGESTAAAWVLEGYHAYREAVAIADIRITRAFGCAVRHGLTLTGPAHRVGFAGPAASGNLVTRIDDKDALVVWREMRQRAGDAPAFLGAQGDEPGYFRLEAPVETRRGLKFRATINRDDVLREVRAEPDRLYQAAVDCAQDAHASAGAEDPALLFVVPAVERFGAVGRTVAGDVVAVRSAMRGCCPLLAGFYGRAVGARGGGHDRVFSHAGVGALLVGQGQFVSIRHEAHLAMLADAGRALASADSEQELVQLTLGFLTQIGLDGGLAAVGPLWTRRHSARQSALRIWARGSRWEAAARQLGDRAPAGEILERLRVDPPGALRVGLQASADPRGLEGWLWVAERSLLRWEREGGDLPAVVALATLAGRALRGLRRREELHVRLDELDRTWREDDERNVERYLRDGAELAADLTDSEIASIRLLDSERDALVCRALYPDALWTEALADLVFPISEPSLGAEVMLTNAPLLANEVRHDPLYRQAFPGERHALLAPLREGGRAFGVVAVSRRWDVPYTHGDLHTLFEIAYRLAATIVYARAHQRAETLRQVAVAFLGQGRGGYEPVPLGEALGSVARCVKRVLGSRACGIFLVEDDEPQRLVLRAHTEPALRNRLGEPSYSLGEGLTGWCASARRPIRLRHANDPAEIRAKYGGEPTWTGGLHDLPHDDGRNVAFVAAPILTGENRVIGVIRCSGKEALERFTPEDEALLVGIAELAAIGITRAWTFESLRARNAWLAQFLRLAGHQLRTPVNNLAALLELRQDLARDDAGRVLVVDLLRLRGMVDGLMAYAQTEGDLRNLARSRLDLVRLVEEELSSRSVRMAAEAKQVRMAENFAGRPHVTENAALLRQCLNNLLMNAIKYAPADSAVGVTVRLGTAAVARDGRLVAEAKEGTEDVRDAAVIVMSDEGPGIAPENLALVFDELVSIEVEGVPSGTGMGLPIARRIARTFGGDVVVESRLGHGSRFKVILPLAGQAE